MSTALVTTLLHRVILRQWRLAPRATLLLTGILALGVAVYVSIRLANRAAVASFTHFTDTLTGQSDWIIQAPAGALAESVLPELRRALGARPVHVIPVLEATAAAPAAGGDGGRFGRPSYTLLGVDLIGVSNLARSADGVGAYYGQSTPDRADSAEAADFWEALRAGPQVWISPEFAPTPPRQLSLVLDERVVELRVAGVIPSAPEAPRVPANLMVMDLASLQRLTGKEGWIDRIEFIVEAGPRQAEQRAELAALLAELGRDRWSLSSPGARRESAEVMTRAFRLNLTVLSLIALLVGLYLIFQALDGAVVRRRGEIAVLRSLGVEERTIRQVWLAEAAVLGLVGGTLGVALGWLGAQVSVRAVGQTVNALYFGTTVNQANLSVSEALLGIVLGVVTSVAAGWWPASAAARTPPAQVLHRGSAPAVGARWARSPMIAGGCLLLAVACAQLPGFPLPGGGRFPVAGYAAAFLAIFGGGILCSHLLAPVARLASAWGRRRAPACVALSHLRQPSGRHRLAAAALHCAIGMTAGMAILVGSFDQTVRNWVQRTLQADLYIASDGAQTANAQNRISADAAAALAAHPTVAAANVLVAWRIELDGRPTVLSGTDFAVLQARMDLPWIDPPPAGTAFIGQEGPTPVVVSESFTERFDRRSGDSVRVTTSTGSRDLRIVGVFADYGNEQGSILLDRSHLVDWFRDTSVTSVSLWLQPGVDADTVRADLLAQYPGLSVLTNSRLRAEILRIFRQTFAITYALEIIGVLVAVIGLVLTLTSVLLDRRDELTTLRALGFSRHEIAVATAIEGTALSAAAVAGGLALSLGLGWLLIHVINKQSFGWTLGFALPWGQLAALGLLVTLAGAAVSYGVGRWGANLPADQEA
jgi:putative ABC transport system permease protein